MFHEFIYEFGCTKVPDDDGSASSAAAAALDTPGQIQSRRAAGAAESLACAASPTWLSRALVTYCLPQLYWTATAQAQPEHSRPQQKGAALKAQPAVTCQCVGAARTCWGCQKKSEGLESGGFSFRSEKVRDGTPGVASSPPLSTPRERA